MQTLQKSAFIGPSGISANPSERGEREKRFYGAERASGEEQRRSRRRLLRPRAPWAATAPRPAPSRSASSSSAPRSPRESDAAHRLSGVSAGAPRARPRRVNQSASRNTPYAGLRPRVLSRAIPPIPLAYCCVPRERRLRSLSLSPRGPFVPHTAREPIDPFLPAVYITWIVHTPRSTAE